MEIIKKGFNVTYEALIMENIRPAGVYVNKSGRTYPASVKFRCSIESEVEDEVLGLKDLVETVEFKIVCNNDIEAGNVNRLLRELKKQGQIINIKGSIPTKSDWDDYPVVEAFEHGIDFLNKYQKEVKKAS